MNDILNRIHLGIMGNALCHATYGWFCEIVEPEPSEWVEIVYFDMDIVPLISVSVEL